MSRSRSQALRTRLALSNGLLGAATQRMLDRPELPELIPAYLLLIHQMIRASVPLMETARREAMRRDDDPVCRGLVDYLARHIEEEMHHDAWTAEDLESIGFERARIFGTNPPASVASLVGAQYYWVLHHHPVALLGYIALLEGNPQPPESIDELQTRTGLPASAFRTMRLHATADPGHTAALDRFIDELPLDDDQESLIAVSAAHTGASFAYCLSELQPWEAARAGATRKQSRAML
jgi:hypothetical protein